MRSGSQGFATQFQQAHTFPERAFMTISRFAVLFSLLTSPLLAGGLPASFPSKFESQLHLMGTCAWAGGLISIQDEGLDNVVQGKKSVGLAAVYSLLLPGMGELYAEGFGSGKYFLLAEGALWLTFATFEVYGNALRDDARTFSVSHAGVNPAGKDDQFYVDIGNFLNIDEYNEKQLQDREPEKLYDPAQGYSWRWDADELRLAYREQRVSSETMFNNKKFVVAAILINHVASAINAARAAISHNNAIEDALGDLSLSAGVMGGIRSPHGIVLTLSRSF